METNVGALRKKLNLKGKTLITASGNEFIVTFDDGKDYFIKVKCTKVADNSKAFLSLNDEKQFGNDALVTLKESS